ncbi:MAG: alpha-galactosidase [Candidatus Limivicinus sp.]
MIRHIDRPNGHFIHIGNGTLSCILKITYGKAELLHLGAPLNDADCEALCCETLLGLGTGVLYRQGDSRSCLDDLPLAWSERGTGDYRESPIELLFEGADICPDFVYSSCGTPAPDESDGVLPHARGAADRLKLTFRSANALLKGLVLELRFSLFETALVRQTVLYNGSDKPLQVTKLMSACADLPGRFTVSTFDGGWIREAHIHTVPVTRSRVVNESTNGFSSNRHNPGFLLSAVDAGDDAGEVYGFNLLWSGNHCSSVQRSASGFTRVLQGISPEGLCLGLLPGERLETPEAVVAWSDRGRNGMMENMHRFVNASIIPEAWRYRERPVLYNNWEGCLFDFHEAKLLSLAKKAKKIGCELFVLDDGWFGARDSDTAGLGDYSVNERKLPNGLEGLSEKIRALGLDFGLWFEPEAVNPDSECYRSHPDWALTSPGADAFLSRNELLLDLTKPEVRDYIVESVSAILDRAEIRYVKWDMNRPSPVTGNKAYEYILGLYEVLHRIFDPRPQILLEGCASGGNRFDLGMLCFAPQIWGSDDTDPIERLDIQDGLFCLYPPSTVGAHISAAPHAQTLRHTPLSTRANAAFFGAFGVEFDLDGMKPVEAAELKESIAWYKEHRKTFQFGRFSRNRAEEGALCWQVSGEDETLCGLFHRLVEAGPEIEWLSVNGLDPNRLYRVEARPQMLRVAQFGGLLKHITPIARNAEGAAVRLADRHYRMRDGGFSAACSGAALRSGIPLSKRFAGSGYDPILRVQGDFGSNIFCITPQ